MPLSDNPVDHILHMFRMEMRTNPTHACEIYPDGFAPDSLPLTRGERIYGALSATYLFTPLGFIWREDSNWKRFDWAKVKGCNSTRGSGDRHALMTLTDGSKARVPLDQFGPGWGGRIGQLFFAMIDRWRAPLMDSEFLLTPDRFFALAKDDFDIAPNMYPHHPGLKQMRARLDLLAGVEGVKEVFLVVTDYEGDIPCVQEVLLVCAEHPADAGLAFMEFDFVGGSPTRTARLFGPTGDHQLLISGIWD